MENEQGAPEKSLAGRVIEWLAVIPAMLGPVTTGILALVLVVALFYQEENWRGRRAWAQARAEAAAAGKIVDWTKVIPPKVNDEDNFFAAPDMQNWFTGRGARGISSKLDFRCFETWREKPDTLVARVTFVKPGTPIAPGDADLVLRYADSQLTLLGDHSEDLWTNSPKEKIPLIVMDDVPLTDAIKHLAKAANVSYKLDPKINYGQTDANGNVHAQPTVTIRWTNVSGLEGFKALLANYNLMMIPNPKTGIAHIKVKDPAKNVFVATNITARLTRLVQEAIAPATNIAGEHLTAALGFEISARPLGPTKPAHITVVSETVPYSTDVRDFFPKTPLGLNFKVNWGSEVQARLEGSNTFQVFLVPPPRVAAADYAAWSDQFEPVFDQIREATKRPYARMDGDYAEPYQIPIPNFITLRTTAQTLCQRAQSHMLLGQPEKALRDLMLVREICRITEARPTGKPMTLIAAMVNTAIEGLYVSVFADGVRLRVWREADLAALEQQMKEINLPPLLASALDMERLSSCQLLQTATAENWHKAVTGSDEPQTLKQQLQDPVTRFLMLAPRGWVYQNMAFITELHLDGVSGYDPATGLIAPRQADAAISNIGKSLDKPSAKNVIAQQCIPNFSRAVFTVAYNQTLVNEARVVCALERHRLAHGRYPEMLDELVPQFVDKIPNDIIGGKPLKYRRDGNDFTLYSVGWNETDDQGKSFLKPDDYWSGDKTKGDWVWVFGRKS